MFGIGPMELLFLIPMLAVPLSAFYLALRWIRAKERQVSGGNDIAALKERISQLEDAVDESARELRALREGHDFTSQILAQRSSAQRGAAVSPG